MKRVVGLIYDLSCRFPLGWIVVKVFLTGLPGVILGYAAIRFSLQPGGGYPFQAELQNLLASFPLITAVLFLLPLALTVFYTWADNKIASIKDQEKFPKLLSASLIQALNDLVGVKLRRFDAFSGEMNSGKKGCEVFQSITQPSLQIKQIALSLHHVLEKTLDDSSLQLVLVRIQDSAPSLWVEHIPNQLQPPDRFLGEDALKTLFHDAARQNKALWITDIAKHMKNKKKRPLYCPQQDPDLDVGSIICYPIFHKAENKVVYALSIKSDRPNAITGDFKKTYTLVMDAFITRLLLEHNLVYIKERSEICQTA